MTMILKVVLFITLFLPCYSLLANPQYASREYKQLLNVTEFDFANEDENVNSFVTEFKYRVEAALDRDVDGTPVLEKVRTVEFFDVQGNCTLKNSGYIFRERIEDPDSEVTLKHRSSDRYIPAFSDMSSDTTGAETKLEADIGSKNGDMYKVVYSHSTTSPNDRKINDFKDINHHFPGFDQAFNYDDDLLLTKVGDLTVYERVYKGVFIDLGSIDAELSITLWYTSEPTGNVSPIVAEASFKYKDPSATYTRKVVKRAAIVLAEMQNMSMWANANSATKTQTVYQFDPTFCQ